MLAENHSSISNATKLAIIDDLKTKMTLLQIAKERDVSPTTVRKILDTAILYQSQLPFPEVICIDEFCYKHSATKEGKYPAVISNPFTGDIIDGLEGAVESYYFSNKNCENHILTINNFTSIPKNVPFKFFISHAVDNLFFC